MNFRVNNLTTNLALSIILLKIIESGLFFVFPDISLNDSVIIIIDVLNFIGTAYIYFYLKNYTSQVIGTVKLNFPLLAIGWLLLLLMIMGTLCRLNILASTDYLNILLGTSILLGLLNIFLIVKIFSLPSGTYKKYLISFGFFLILNFFVSPTIIALRQILFYRNGSAPDYIENLVVVSKIIKHIPFVLKIIIHIPFLLIGLMLLKYKRQNGKNVIYKGNNQIFS